MRPRTEPAGDPAWDRALRGLGVHDGALDDAQRAALDRDGWVVLPAVVGADRLQAMRDAYEAILAREAELSGLDHHREAGARRIGDLVNKGAVWDALWLHPAILACAQHVIGAPFRLAGCSGRDPLPGRGHQRYHRDVDEASAGAAPRAALSCCLLLDDFTPTNGPLRVVPGSHARPGPTPADPDPGERLVLAPAGAAIAFNAHLQHGGGANRDGALRRMVHVQYVRRELPFWLEHQRETIRLAAWRRLPPAARRVLGL